MVKKDKKYKIEFGDKQLKKMVDVIFISGLSLICAGISYIFSVLFTLVFTGNFLTYYELLGFYMVFQIAFTFAYVNGNIKIDWGF